MFSTEDDPERKQHSVEDALTDVTKQQHPGPVETHWEPFNWDIDECHGDSQSKDNSNRTQSVQRYDHYQYTSKDHLFNQCMIEQDKLKQLCLNVSWNFFLVFKRKHAGTS